MYLLYSIHACCIVMEKLGALLLLKMRCRRNKTGENPVKTAHKRIDWKIAGKKSSVRPKNRYYIQYNRGVFFRQPLFFRQYEARNFDKHIRLISHDIECFSPSRQAFPAPVCRKACVIDNDGNIGKVSRQIMGGIQMPPRRL